MDSRPTPDFGALIRRVCRELSSRGLSCMLIGGQAVLIHGEPRLTQDIDVTLGVAPDRLDDLLDACSALELEPLPEDPHRFVFDTYVLPVVEPASTIRVDFIFSTTLYEAQAIQRAVRVDVGGEAVPFATPEDLVIHKLFAGRPRDLEDAAGVVRRQGGNLDWAYMRHWAQEFAAVPGRENMPSRLEGLAR